MASISNFEDLVCWQLAREISKMVYQFTLSEKFSRDFSLINQIRSSSGSVMDNIAEGFDRGGNKEFIQFLSISRGSLSEVKSQLYRAKDQEYINQEEQTEAIFLINKTRKAITGLMNYLRGSNLKGFKYQ